MSGGVFLYTDVRTFKNNNFLFCLQKALNCFAANPKVIFVSRNIQKNFFR